MSLLVWMPLNGDLHNQGLSNITATNNGATVDTNGKIGSCYSFDGSDDFINLGSIGSYFDGSAFSICFWIFSLEDKTRAAVFSSYGLSSTSNFFGLEINSSNNNYCNNNLRFDWLSSDTYSPDNFVTYNTWTHICVTYDGVNQIKMYKNGELIQTSTRVLNAIPIGNTYYLGRDSRTGSTAFKGKMNDFRIYDTALSPREIKEISKGLVAHYTLSGFGQDNLIVDSNRLSVSASKNNKNASKRGTSTRQLNEHGFYEAKVTSSFGGLCVYANQYNFQVGDVLTYSFSIYTNGSSKSYTFYPMMYLSSGSRDTSTKISTSLDGGSYTSVNSKSFGTISSTTPNRHYVTFIWNENVKSIIDNGGSIELSIQIHGSWASGDWGCVFAPKLEYGDKPTPWLPNSADPLYSVLGLNDGIEYDVSGYENNGTKTNVVFSPDTPKYKGSSYFDGTSLIQANPLSSEVKTISVWCKTTKNKSTSQFICQDSASGLCVTFYKGTIISHLGGSSSTGSKCTLGDSYIENGWNHFVVLKTGTHTRDVYCNGVKLTPTSNDYWSPTTGFLVGARNMSNGLPFYGYISDLRAYTTLLSEEDILTLYNTPISLSSNGTLLTQGEYVEV